MAVTKNIVQQLDEIVEQVCTEYCKYPAEAEHKRNSDQWLLKKCEKCPLNRLT